MQNSIVVGYLITTKPVITIHIIITKERKAHLTELVHS